jgi:transporter family protein
MQSWVLFSIGSAVFAGLVAIFGKIGIANVDSTLATTVRALIMGIFLAIISLSLGKFDSLSTLMGKPMLFIMLSGVAGALSWLCYFVALKYGPASGVAAIDRTSVVFVLIFAALFLAEKITLKSGLGALMIALGAILMSF